MRFGYEYATELFKTLYILWHMVFISLWLRCLEKYIFNLLTTVSDAPFWILILVVLSNHERKWIVLAIIEMEEAYAEVP